MTRQWEVLRDIDAARTGITIPKLAAARKMHQRTIRRDIEALTNAGFPLFDEKVNGTTMWKLRAKPFRGLEETGLSIVELCALYFSRAMLKSMAGAPFQDDAERAFVKIEKALPAGCRKFLDNLPVMLKAKIAGRKIQDERKVRDVVTRATEAALGHRRVTMRYDSASSGRTKEYLVEPLRFSYVDGGVYLTAFVPEYGEMRNFAAERIRTLGVTEDRFEPRPLPVEPFANSIGVFSGPAERVVIEFTATVADYVSSREWHKSQSITRRDDGSIVLALDVCVDVPLRAWVLGFGASARVVEPARLALDILDQLERARARYVPLLPLEMLRMSEAAGSRRVARGAMPDLWRVS